ncbi:conserved hypothetical protein [Ricinus communis]|uniref:Uncharacterized protein n=1 Tax=Ricinus communis TaxID=3988 RepID=B9T8B1_RICCO|nr:conserved hypothetical protein [Ricinus communis]
MIKSSVSGGIPCASKIQWSRRKRKRVGADLLRKARSIGQSTYPARLPTARMRANCEALALA